MSLLVKWSRQGFAELVRAGREWEEEVAEPTVGAASRSTTIAGATIARYSTRRGGSGRLTRRRLDRRLRAP